MTTSFEIKNKKTMGLAAMQGRGFYYPFDLDFDSNDKIYVLGRGHDYDPRGARITVMDMEEKYYGTFGSFGDKEGQFIWPSSIAINRKDKIYISDEYLNKITIMTTEGDFISSFGKFGDSEGEFDGPNGLVFDNDNQLYVVDHRNGRIQIFDEDGNYIRQFSSEGESEGELNLPWGITLHSSNNLYISDWGNHRIQEFSTNGEFIRTIGTKGNNENNLLHPSACAVDEEGYIYVSDWGNHKLKVFDKQGKFLCSNRGEATLSKWAQDFLDTNVQEKEARLKANLVFELESFKNDPFAESSHVEKLFWCPTSISFHKQKLLVVDSSRHRIQVFNTVDKI